ncbi:SRPBCC family protein [Mariniflexile sp. HNIBRBA6329]|uniref:SRPBCC family protein n=1 Tax=Mariniflexile sp. HNIBRBA6329 TaxID=3373088 RepID=UPI0037469869
MKNRITIEVVVNVNLQKVWDFWTKPEHIVNWNFASDDWHCPKATNDLRVGGKFSATMASKDGTMSFDFEGVYNEVVELNKIAYAMADGRQVLVAFEKQGNTTVVTEVFDPEDQNPLEMQKNGWQSILNNFKEYVEAN